MRSIVLAIAIAFGSSAFAHAQQLPLLDGMRVRVTAPVVGLDHYIGTIARMNADSIWLRAADSERARPLDIGQLTLLEVGRRSSHVGPGFVLGLVAGATVGFIVTNRQCDVCGRDGPSMPPSAVGALAGSALGALIGLTLPVDRWRPVLRAAPLGPRGQETAGQTRGGPRRDRPRERDVATSPCVISGAGSHSP